MRQAKFLLPILLALALVAGCGSTSSADKLQNDDVAVVVGTHVDRASFDALLAQAKQSYKQQGRAFPKQGTADYQTIKGQIVTLLVQQAERAQRAKSMGITVTDKDVQARLDQIKKQYFGGSEAKYKAQLAKQKLTDSLVRDDIRAQLISEAVFNKVTKDVTVSDKEVHDYYTSHPSLYSQPQTRDVRYILVGKSKATAEQVYRQLEHGTDKTWCTLGEEVREGLERPELRQGHVLEGADGGRVRQGGILDADQDDPQAVLRPDAVQGLVRRRAARAGEEGDDDAREAGGGLDQAAAPAAEEEPGDDRLGIEADEELLHGHQDPLPGRVRAEP